MLRSKACGLDRKGFVLLFVLMTLLLVSAIVVGFSNHSMKVATEALVMQIEMRQRWGNISSQRVLMKHATKLLGPSSGETSDSGHRQVVIRYRLGETIYEGLLQDESAKLDLNTFSTMVNRDQLGSVIKSLTRSNKPIIQISPLPNEIVVNEVAMSPLLSWDQVLQNVDGTGLAPRELLNETEFITLWGGKINFKTAPDSVLEESIRPLLGPILADRIVALREDEPELNWTEIKVRLNMTEQQSTKLDKLIANGSRCYSLWLVSRAGNSEKHSLLLRRRYANSVERFYSFYW